MYRWDTFQGTAKQREIMEKIFDAHEKGEKITITDLYLSLSYAHTCSRQAVTCSVEFLEKKWGLIKKSERHGNFRYLEPTERAFRQLRNAPHPDEEVIETF